MGFTGLFVLAPTVSNHTHSDDTKKAPSPYKGDFAFLPQGLFSVRRELSIESFRPTDDPTMGTGQLATALQCMTCVF